LELGEDKINVRKAFIQLKIENEGKSERMKGVRVKKFSIVDYVMS
jgi:hypothetical protein